MADPDKVGRPWQDDELDAIVADYFAMLAAELAGRAYVKSAHSRDLMARIGRTHRSVEFKHQNISAVLEELGLPWIHGYKPKRNYQAAIFDAIDRYLAHDLGVLGFVPAVPPVTAPSDAVFVEPPAPPDRSPVPAEGLRRLAQKYDASERDNRNRALGTAGEEFVVRLERRRLLDADRSDLARRVRWVAAEDGDGAGYDVLSFDLGGRERIIEVKTTNGSARTPFFLTRNELETAAECADRWRLYRVHLFATRPRIFELAPPLEPALTLRPETWRASIRPALASAVSERTSGRR